ncbi:MAG TPA: bacillithiol biosynthesis cysteine-adding enzyme BshC [Candidatus Angelobacter sp.]|nr:bacillithiol biosynthesis cysteine-adding enzyme BshC [Candidatus Angelobacter sp.]
MKADCLPFSSIPNTPPLFLDFLHHFDKVRQFYARPPAFPEWWKDELPHIRFPQGRRQQIAEILERQNRHFGSGNRTQDNIQRLKNGAPAVVTGQQVALFGGPTFVVLKALTAALLAEQAGAVPVLWLATEDHDLAEVNFVHIPAGDHLETLTTTPPHQAGAPVGTIVFNDEIATLLKRVEEQFGNSQVMEFLKSSYCAGESFGSAFGKFYAQIFGDSGIVLLDPSDPDVHQISSPVYGEALLKSSAINDVLMTRQQGLEKAGYEAQVNVTPLHTLCFYLDHGARLPIRQNPSNPNDGFVVGEKQITHDALVRETGEHPEHFSANVLLRPVIQDYLLPTLCYVGGPSEISYFAQVEVVYRMLLNRVTPVVPRISATVIEPRTTKLLERYQLAVGDIFRGPEKLREYIAEKALPDSIMRSFDAAAEHLEKAIDLIQDPLAKLDPTLKDAAENAASKMRYQLQNLREKAARAEARKNTELQRHADELSTLLYPNKTLQEREVGSAYFLLKYGMGLLQQLREKLQLGCLEHQVIELEKG